MNSRQNNIHFNIVYLAQSQIQQHTQFIFKSKALYISEKVLIKQIINQFIMILMRKLNLIQENAL